MLLPTRECNLACDYCFERRTSGRWTVERTGWVLERVGEAVERRGLARLQVNWQGGEPLLLGVEYWAAVLPRARAMAERAGLPLEQTLQTNLTLYRSELAPLVREFLGGRLGSSFEDSSTRRFPGEDASRFRRCWREALAAAQADGLEVGVLALLGPEALARGAVGLLTCLRDEYGVRALKFNLPFRTPHGNGLWLDPAATGAFLRDAWRLWCDRGGDAWLRIRPFSELAAALRGDPAVAPAVCTFVRDCTEVGLSVATDGTVTLCDDFIDHGPEAHYGNLFRESLPQILSSAGRARVRAAVHGLLDGECAACRYLPVCFGGCLARARPPRPGEPPRFHYCPSYRMLFGAIEESLASEPSGRRPGLDGA